MRSPPATSTPRTWGSRWPSSCWGTRPPLRRSSCSTPVTCTVLDAVTRRGNPSRLATLTVPLRNPLLWGVVAGTAANLGGVDLKEWGGGYPAQGLEMLGRVAVPLMMLALGMSLAGAPRPLRNPAPEEAAPPPSGSPTRSVQSVQSARQGQEPQVAEAGSEAHAADTTEGRLPREEGAPALGARSWSHHGAGRRSGLWLAVGWKLAVMPGLAAAVGLAAGLSGAQLLAPVVTATLPTAQRGGQGPGPRRRPADDGRIRARGPAGRRNPALSPRDRTARLRRQRCHCHGPLPVRS